MRLFLFPFAGGSPTAFWKWAMEFPGHFESWIAHYPGRGSRFNETPIKQIDILVDKLYQSIRLYLDKPFVFFGHSLGGLVAFELVKVLRQENLPEPKVLFVSACGAPQYPDPNMPIHALPDAEFRKALQELNGTPVEILAHPDLMELLTPTLRADFEAFERYNYIPNESPLNFPIVAFGGENDSRVSRARLDAWAAQTNSPSKVECFPGDHFFIIDMKEAVMRSIVNEIMISVAQEPK